MKTQTFLLFGAAFLASARAALKHRAPVLDLQGNDKFRGTFNGAAQEIIVSPEIRVIDGSGPICEYILTSEKEDEEVKFLVEVRSQENGEGVLKLKEGQKLSCKESPATFSLVAKRCDDGPESDSASLEVVVGKTNNHIPEFEDEWYSKTVEEGRLYGEILRLKARDEDCDSYGEICRYEITNNAVPFQINEQGCTRS